MIENDPWIQDSEGKLQALRYDAQVTFLQLLPFVYSNSHIGVAQFTDHISYNWPGKPSKELKPIKPGKKLTDLERGGLPLLPWQRTDLDPKILSELVRPPVTKPRQPTRVDQPMRWAHHRVELARERSGQGPAMLILLTDGDPDNAVDELSGRKKLVTDAASELAAADIRVYPVIINRASYRPDRPGLRPEELPGKDKAAEQLMERVASLTQGKTYRITPTFDLLDVFFDILGDAQRDNLSPTEHFTGRHSASFPVSKHHRSVILIGSALRSIQIAAANGKSSAGEYSLPMVSGIDTDSGIERKIIPLTKWDIVILRRPANLDRAGKFWCGYWHPMPQIPGSDYKGRVYLIPDFLLRISAKPAHPWWAHERAWITVAVAERPRELGEPDRAVPPLEGKDLSLELVARPIGGGKPVRIEGGQWDTFIYKSAPFQLTRPGQYHLSCDCRDHLGHVDIPLGTFTKVFTVEPTPVSLQLLKAPTDETVFEIPAGQSLSTAKGGDRIRAQLVPRDKIGPATLSGHVSFMGITPEDFPFSVRIAGYPATEAITLPLGAKRLDGHAEIQVQTGAPVGARTIAFRDLKFLYNQAPPQLALRFADSRNALWVGELHEQIVEVSVYPVFDEPKKSLEDIVRSFPTELSEARMHAVDDRDQESKPIPVRCLLEGTPHHVTKNQIPSVVATYRLESESPIPPSNRCEIDLGTVVLGLRGEKKEYPVVDPVAGGLLTWYVFQNPDDSSFPGVADVLYQHEPVEFVARWEANRNVSKVCFEIERPDAAEPLIACLPIDAGADQARTRWPIGQLQAGQIYSAHVNVALGPSRAHSPINLRLNGGRFLVDDHWPQLKEFVVGDTAGTDIPCRAFEVVDLPLRASFTGYVPGHPQHRRVIEEFKESCTLKVLIEKRDTEDLSRTIQWTSVEPPSATEGPWGLHRFEGHATYIPQRIGLASIELSGRLEAKDRLSRIHMAYARFSVGPPLLSLTVIQSASKKEQERVLFDSLKWALGEFAVRRITWRFAERLILRIQRANVDQGTDAKPWRIEVRVIRSAEQGAEVAHSREVELETGGSSVDVDYTPPEAGRYAVEVVSLGPPTPGAVALFLRTPELVNWESANIVTILAPSGKVTAKSREWPFEYHVEIQPDWPARAEAFIFEFLMPGQDEWNEGRAIVISQNRRQWLVCRSPEFLPPLDGVKDGQVTFRLSVHDELRVDWKSPEVTVAKAKLQEVRVSGFAHSNTLSAEAVLGMAPSLQWTPKQVTTYILRDPPKNLTPTSAETLYQLILRTERGDQEVRVVAPHTATASAKESPLHQRDKAGFLPWLNVVFSGWLRLVSFGLLRVGACQEYAVFVSATYAEEIASESSTASTDEQLHQRIITEWSDPYLLRGIPFASWLFLGVALLVVVVQVLKKFALAPDKLKVDLRVQSGAAVDPKRHGNPLLAEIKRSSVNELKCYVQHVWCRWGIPGKSVAFVLSKPAGASYRQRLHSILGAVLGIFFQLPALLVALLVVLLRWAFWPGYRAWVRVVPIVRDGALYSRTGLVGLWTVVFWPNGGLRSSTGNIGWKRLPENGAVDSCEMPLGFRMRDENRKRDNPVWLEISR